MSQLIDLDGLNEFKSQMINLIFPVGAIYTSYENVSPASRFGGTWEAIEGKFLLSADQGVISNASMQALGYTCDTNSGKRRSYWKSNESTSETYTNHSITPGTTAYSEIDGKTKHFHYQSGGANNAAVYQISNDESKLPYRVITSGYNLTVTNATETVSHPNIWAVPTFDENTMPPYQVVYMWRRTA